MATAECNRQPVWRPEVGWLCPNWEERWQQQQEWRPWQNLFKFPRVIGGKDDEMRNAIEISLQEVPIMSSWCSMQCHDMESPYPVGFPTLLASKMACRLRFLDEPWQPPPLSKCLTHVFDPGPTKLFVSVNSFKYRIVEVQRLLYWAICGRKFHIIFSLLGFLLRMTTPYFGWVGKPNGMPLESAKHFPGPNRIVVLRALPNPCDQDPILEAALSPAVMAIY